MAAALLVFLWHTNGWHFSNGVILRVVRFPIGAEHLAVVVFFVLSGYLIALSASKPGTTWQSYLVHRVSRLSSVTIPALLVTAVVACVAGRLAPAALAASESAGFQPLRYLINAAYLQQSWWFCVVPGMNTPFWSLGYEAWYYCALGLAVFAPKSKKLAALLLLAALIGPKVILMLPTWLAGVAAFRTTAGAAMGRTRLWIIFGGSLALMLAAMAKPALIPFQSQKIGQAPWYYSYNYAADFLFAAVTGANFWAARRLGDRPRAPAPGWMAAAGRLGSYGAGMTFSLYLYHVPLLFLFGTFGTYDRASLGAVTKAALLVLAIAGLLAHFTERKSAFWRRATQRVFDGVAGFGRWNDRRIRLGSSARAK